MLAATSHVKWFALRALAVTIIVSAVSASTNPLRAQEAPVQSANVKLNFPDQMELTLLVDYVSQRLGVKILYDEQVGGKRLTIKAPTEIPAESLLTVLESALKIKGLALVDADVPGWKQIVPIRDLALKKLIEEYNKGLDVDLFFAKLMAFTKELSEEEKRGVSEQLTEEELSVFDILMKPEIEMTAADKKLVRDVARKLLHTLKEAKLVLDWRKKQRTRADVYSTVRSVLDELPHIFTPELYQQKCDGIYQHVYDSYPGEGVSIYESA
jgi:hypothetical protein